MQEALGNIRKHSGARTAKIGWESDDYRLTLSITDDGIGFDPEDVPPISRHGLQTMRERSELLGADFQIVSRPGRGAVLSVRIPLQELDGVARYG